MNKILRYLLSIVSLMVYCGSASWAAGTDMTPIYMFFEDDQQETVTYNLTLQPSGSGIGIVDASPAGLSCGDTCITYPAGTVVTLTATPDETSSFAGWSGGGCSGSGTCEVTMNADLVVTATFVQTAESEPNDTASGANSIALDTPKTGNLDTAGDQDWYFFDIDEPAIVGVWFDVPSALNEYEPSYWRVQVWQENSDGPDTLLQETIVTKGEEDIFNVNLPAAGRYYIVVLNREYFSAWGYELTLLSNDSTFDPAEEEVNDSSAAANPLDFDQTMHGTLMRLDDEDWYRVETDVDRTVTVTFSGNPEITGADGGSEGAKGDWVVEVYSNGDTSADMIKHVQVKEGSSFDVAILASASPYYFVVRDTNTSLYPNYYNQTPYKLTLLSNDGQPLASVGELEGNDTLESATPGGSVDTAVTGQLMSPADIDWFSIENPTAGSVTFTFFSDADYPSYWYFSLYSSNGDPVFENVDGADNWNYDRTVTLAAGTYYLKVIPGWQSNNYFSTYQYKVTAEAQ